MDPLEQARQVRHLMAQGKTNAQARHALGLPPKGKGGKTAMVTTRKNSSTVVVRVPSGPTHHRKRGGSGENIVVNAEGEVTTRGGANLHANYGGFVPVQFDGPAVGATLEGMFRQLQFGSNANLAVIFPSLYPVQAAAAQASRQYAQERQIGAEMGKLLGAALEAFGVTAEMWGTWYAQAKANAPPLPPAQQWLGQTQGGQQQQGGTGFGSPLLLPSAVTGPFGQVR